MDTHASSHLRTSTWEWTRVPKIQPGWSSANNETEATFCWSHSLVCFDFECFPHLTWHLCIKFLHPCPSAHPSLNCLPQCSLRTLWHCPRSSVQSLHIGGAAERSLSPDHQRLVRPLPPHPDPGRLAHFKRAVSPTSYILVYGGKKVYFTSSSVLPGTLWVTAGSDCELDWRWEQHCPLLHDGCSQVGNPSQDCNTKGSPVSLLCIL